MANANILFACAIVENGYEKLHTMELVAPGDIVEREAGPTTPIPIEAPSEVEEGVNRERVREASSSPRARASVANPR
ncbi:MAG: hypothetical protein AAGN82_25695, partial [Myxococcota bacterium]